MRRCEWATFGIPQDPVPGMVWAAQNVAARLYAQNVMKRTFFLVILAIAPAWSMAQPGPGTVPLEALRNAEATVGSPAERTLLHLELIGSSRPLTLARGPAAQEGAPLIAWVLPTNTVWGNTRRARADRDGAVWQGKGLTGAVSGGVVLTVPWISLSLRPVAFATQNLAFDPAPADPDDPQFRPATLNEIDMPFRIARTSYGRVDPGESWLRVGNRVAGAGFTTASQHWGPAHFYPLTMGTEGPGYPRAFVEARDANLWIGRMTAHWSVGRLETSPMSLLPAGERSRLATAVVAGFSPAFMRGLQVGGARFFHLRWRRGVLAWPLVSLPFTGFLKEGNPTGETFLQDYNQLASVFARVAPPGGGVEAYGEFYREDHNVNERDLAGEPDHVSAYTIGVRRAVRRDGGVDAVTIENTNGRLSHLLRVRPQGPPYVHGRVPEGHTYLGQPLGSTAAFAGGGLRVSYDRARARRTLVVDAEVRRTAQNQEGGAWNGEHTGQLALGAGGRRMSGTRVYGLYLGVQRSFGAERGVNGTLSASVSGW